MTHILENHYSANIFSNTYTYKHTHRERESPALKFLSEFYVKRYLFMFVKNQATLHGVLIGTVPFQRCVKTVCVIWILRVNSCTWRVDCITSEQRLEYEHFELCYFIPPGAKQITVYV